MEDLESMDFKPDMWSRTSDHFETLLVMCERLLKEGKAYVDDTDAETMRKERELRKDSKRRNQSLSFKKDLNVEYCHR